MKCKFKIIWLDWLNRIPIIIGARFNITDPKKEDVMITMLRKLQGVFVGNAVPVIARRRRAPTEQSQRGSPPRIGRICFVLLLLLLYTLHFTLYTVYAQQERLLVAQEQTYNNIIANASFESWSNGTGTADSVPDAWTKEGAPTTYDKLSADKRFGSLSAQVVVNAASQGIKQTLTVEPNTTYSVGFYYKTGTGSFAFTITGTITPALSGNTAFSAASWTYKSFAFTTGAATTSITLNFLSEGLTDVFKLDGIMLTKGSFGPAFVEKAFTDTGDHTVYGDVKVQDIDSAHNILLDKDTGNITLTGTVDGYDISAKGLNWDDGYTHSTTTTGTVHGLTLANVSQLGSSIESAEITDGTIAAADLGGGAIIKYKLNELRPHEQTAPDNTAYVEPGIVSVANNVKINFAGGSSPAFSVVTADSRIDLLTLDSAGALGITQGTQAVSPSAPAYPTNRLVIAEVTINETVTVVINNADIIDVRPFLNLGGGVTTDTDNAYVNVSGDTMTGTLNLPANGLVAGTNQLVLSGGNVGIGTTAPLAKLDVRGDMVTPTGMLQTPYGGLGRYENLL
ncbi:carbohydrate binding domain-containing protein, partial [Patescibacteria group bacterium]|nr:carbohydrate binding domain-containing protein [Patescibacteria group bacterium]